MDINDLLKNIPVSDLAQKFGVKEDVMQGALRQAVPGILSGMAANASSEEGAMKLATAAQQHKKKTVSVSDIDTEDGKKIVKKVLGDKEGAVVAALGKNTDSSEIASLIPKLLPVIAPLIMQYLGGQKSSRSTGGITDILGGLLGGDSKSGGVVDILGGILGGGNNKGGGLGGLLGGLLGGGK